MDEGKHLAPTKYIKDKTWRPPDGGKSRKSNPKPNRPKPNALKIKSTSNIQAIKLNIFNKFYQKESLEIFKKTF